MKGLIIKPKWADLILDGWKTMELRGSNTNIRGTIGIIKSGTSKIYGTVELVGCEKLNEVNYYRLCSNHQVRDVRFEDIPYKNLWGWILANPIRYKEPIEYEHKQGCVIWVNIESEE